MMRRSTQPDSDTAVQRAWCSGDLTRMLRALGVKCHPVQRHHLLLAIVRETYRLRNVDAMNRKLCERIARQHIAEFSTLAQALRADDREYGGTGRLPYVPTFQHLATLLAEDGDYSGAVAVCETAIGLGLQDGTKAGYAGRIKRIRATAKRAGVQLD